MYSIFSSLGSPQTPSINSTALHGYWKTKASRNKQTSLDQFPLKSSPSKPEQRSSAAMSGSKQKKSSGSSSSFSFFSLFKGKSRRADDMKDDFVKAYKVWPSDEDRGRWVAEPGIDRETSAFITSRTERWKSVQVAN